MHAHLQCANSGTQEVRHFFVGTTFNMFHDEGFPEGWRQLRECGIEVLPQFRAVEVLIGAREARGLIVFVVAQVRAPNVLQPVLSPVCNDPEEPGIESTADFTEMVIGLDE